MLVLLTLGSFATTAVKGNLLHVNAEETWYASESLTSPVQKIMLFLGSLMKAWTSGERRVSRMKDEVSSCSGDRRRMRRNLRSFFARSRACA